MQFGNQSSRLIQNWTAIVTAALFAVLVIGVFLPYYAFAPVRVGDGSEYYAMFIALKDGHHPWMTAHAFELYDALVSTRSIEGMVTAQALREAFPALHVGATADFNHFWIYSLLGAGIAEVGQIFGLTVHPHHAFLTLHVLLTLGVIWLAQALFGWRGAVAAGAMTVLSPMIWFFDKVHTEYFTYCTVLAAVMLAQRRHLAWSAAFLALASTQNPSFAIVSLALLVWRMTSARSSPLHLWEVGAVVAAVLLALLHPAYYYFRHGVLTPQMLAGGAKLGANVQTFYIWLLDPDVGLLPNWPMGLVLILLTGGLLATRIRQRRFRPDWAMVIFISGFTVVNLFAQSSTTNINSGATPGLARYALWYIPLFFPLVLMSVDWLASLTLPKKALIAVAALGYVVLNAKLYDPRYHEDYQHPSSVSRLIQKRAPGLYDPPVEVFVERFSGLAEGPPSDKRLVILGPSCDKLLVIPGRDPTVIGNPAKCLVNYDKISALAKEVSLIDKDARYIRLSSNENDVALAGSGTYATAKGESGEALLGEGWHEAEDWGTWAATQAAELNIPCPRDVGEFRVSLTLVAFNQERYASINAAERAIWSGKVMSSPTKVTVTVKPDQCVGGAARLNVASTSMDAPKALGMSSDERKLGLALIKIQYER